MVAKRGNSMSKQKVMQMLLGREFQKHHCRYGSEGSRACFHASSLAPSLPSPLSRSPSPDPAPAHALIPAPAPVLAGAPAPVPARPPALHFQFSEYCLLHVCCFSILGLCMSAPCSSKYDQHLFCDCCSASAFLYIYSPHAPYRQVANN